MIWRMKDDPDYHQCVLPSFADNRDPKSFASRMRRRRMEQFADLTAGMQEPVTVLDVGGSTAFWKTAAGELLGHCRVTVVNLTEQIGDPTAGISATKGDGRDLSHFANRSFDLCFSNSVIEHAGTLADQRAMAREIRRVARGYFVQTPYLHFPIEPHFLFPGWQYLPVSMRIALHRRFRLGWMGRQPDPERARAAVEQIRLIDRPTMRALFPDAVLREERIGPLVKSLIAVRVPD